MDTYHIYLLDLRVWKDPKRGTRTSAGSSLTSGDGWMNWVGGGEVGTGGGQRGCPSESVFIQVGASYDLVFNLSVVSCSSPRCRRESSLFTGRPNMICCALGKMDRECALKQRSRLGRLEVVGEQERKRETERERNTGEWARFIYCGHFHFHHDLATARTSDAHISTRLLLIFASDRNKTRT